MTRILQELTHATTFIAMKRAKGRPIMNRVRLGLIGLGEWPRQAYVPVLKELDQVDVVAVAARSSATQDYARRQFGPRVALYSDYRDLLADETIDAVTLAVPNPVHADAMDAVLASGKHFFYEPPIAHTYDQLRASLAAMAASDRVIQPDFELRYVPVVVAANELLRAGAIGQPHMTTVRLWCNWGFGGGKWNYNPEQEGFFPWLGCWYFDLLDVVFADTPLRASVVGGYAANGRLMDHGWASLEYSGGRIGQLEFSLVAVTGLDIRLRVLGSQGELEAELTRGELRWCGLDAAWQEAIHPASLPAHGFVGMRECLADFAEAVRSGRPPKADVGASRRVHASMLACAQAEADRAVVRVRPLE
jgi:predicted dehydrogenase